MDINNFYYNTRDKKLYCITNKGVYSFYLHHFARLIPFKWEGESDILISPKMEGFFIKTMELMYKEDPEIFEYVQYTIFYTYRGKKKSVSYNIYLEALKAWQKMKDFVMYENITTNFDHNL